MRHYTFVVCSLLQLLLVQQESYDGTAIDLPACLPACLSCLSFALSAQGQWGPSPLAWRGGNLFSVSTLGELYGRTFDRSGSGKALQLYSSTTHVQYTEHSLISFNFCTAYCQCLESFYLQQQIKGKRKFNTIPCLSLLHECFR